MLKTFNCCLCKKRKKPDKFYKNKSRWSGLSSRCKDCQKILFKKYEHRKRKDPLKVKARLKLNDYVNRGKVIKENCEVCGSCKKVEGHHDDYSKPLEVRWLCQKHHNEHHQKNKKLPKETK